MYAIDVAATILALAVGSVLLFDLTRATDLPHSHYTRDSQQHSELPTFEHSVRLHNAAVRGLTMPVIGLGTGGWGSWDDKIAADAVKHFLQLGGRRIDTALGYEVQKGIAKGIKASGVPREEIFITSKCDSPAYGFIPGGYNETIRSVNAILDDLQTSYIDLMLIHFASPAPDSECTQKNAEYPPSCLQGDSDWRLCRLETWLALEDLHTDGVLRAIGVSNFAVKHLEELRSYNIMMPAVNQIEYHPYWHPDDILEYCKSHNIVLNGYSPLGAPDVMRKKKDHMPILLLSNDVVMGIAKEVQRSPAQVLLRWSLQQGVVINPRARSVEHLKDDLNLFDFSLSNDQMTRLSNLERPGDKNICGNLHNFA